MLATLEEVSKAFDAYKREKQIATARRRFAAWFRRQGEVLLPLVAKVESKWPVVQESVSTEIRQQVLSALDQMHVKTHKVGVAAFEATLFDAVTMARATGVQYLGVGTSFSLKHPDAVSWAQEHAGARISAVEDATKSEIHDMIVRGLDEGKSYSEVAREIKGRFNEFAVGVPQKHIASRAELVAVTEYGQAYEEGGRSLIDDLRAVGLDMEKMWNAMGDYCDVCEENMSQGWIDSEEAHASGHMHPLAHPACKCNETYRRKGSE
jgi:hypothetical protein